MIQNLYETHLQVKKLGRSIEFYKNLGLELSLLVEERRVAFFYIGKDRQLLGLWEVPESNEVQRRHFAFGTDVELLTGAIDWLREKGIVPIHALGKEPTEPIVHTWMPAAAIYFNDPDHNELELIAWLPDQPQDIGYVPYLSEWNEIVKA
ncbi:glyoxalase/bleomycin resistance protein/dioxygenase [Paenibacillus alvei TS-15]|jgi:lactoylglutathione lyase|uniref:Glyoxalase/bleomycin resistance protein/dioxygenase n=1 Tax=Paenibacillus alvei TS-15 TaxID=1117108 RepID=S9SU47_PAEAL|nr:VOC family protein [Paenibacillus alvei]EPY09307.1 glyoxalase/bleomycin resistance protein/dioxygenase [Paenibacillus alvei TS-15]